MHSSTFKHIKGSLKSIHAHSECVQPCSTVFNRVQCSLRGVHAHSECIQPCSSAFNTRSNAFTCTQGCSSTFTRVQWCSHSVKGIQSGQKTKGPIDMCSNTRSMRNPYIFAPNVCWMSFNVPWLDVIRQKTNDMKLQYWEGENLIGDQNIIDCT
jgi:hypothetical protein